MCVYIVQAKRSWNYNTRQKKDHEIIEQDKKKDHEIIEQDKKKDHEIIEQDKKKIMKL